MYNMKGRSALTAHMGRKHKSNEYPKEYVKYVVDEYYTECKFSIHYCCILYLYKVMMEEMTQEKEEEVIGRYNNLDHKNMPVFWTNAGEFVQARSASDTCRSGVLIRMCM